MIGKGKSVRVLIAPLDWGLGHATRCIPLIGELLTRGADVTLAADGPVARLLAREFPQLEIKPLQGYNIQYGHRFLFLNILAQLPRIFKTIRAEHRWLKALLQKESYDIIISDNRPGFWNRGVTCVYITHQLSIRSGKGKWLDRLLQRLHHRYMKNFQKVWVPDLPHHPNTAGLLSHPDFALLQPQYIGLISRFKQNDVLHLTYDLLVLLSGPEPQRSLLEKKILEQIVTSELKVAIVRGLPGSVQLPDVPEQIDVFNHLTAVQLEQIIQESQLVLCRSGYTTIMDLLKLRKKAVLIPTPGQTEQEYLAHYLYEQYIFPYSPQKTLDVKEVLKSAANFDYHFPFHNHDFELYREVIDELLTSFKEH
jgi:UDP-N-acetylglucosamine transferase subunit ALG13